MQTLEISGNKLLFQRIIAWNTHDDQDFDPMEEDLPDWYDLLENVVEQMIEEGETYWDCPEYNSAIADLFSKWVLEGKLIKLRLAAVWLRSQMPDKVEPSMKRLIFSTADGQYLDTVELYEDHRVSDYRSRWPASAEFYLKHGNLNMAQFSQHIFDDDWLWVESRLAAKSLTKIA